MGIRLGALVDGAISEYDKGIERNRQGIRDARDEERYGQEKADRERKMADDKRSDDIRDRIAAWDKDRMNASGIFGLDKENMLQPKAIDAPLEQTTPSAPPVSSGIAAPMTDAAGQATPVAAAPAPAMPSQPGNFFTSGGEGRYKNQAKADDIYYEGLGALLREDYTNKREYGKAALVKQEIDALRDKGYDRTRKTAAAAVVSGAPADVVSPLVEKAYATINDGKAVKVLGQTVDPKTNVMSYDLEFTDAATGQKTTKPMPAMSLYGLLTQASAFEVAKVNIETNLKFRELDQKDAGLKIDSRKADAAMVSAQATASRASFQNSREQTLDNGVQQAAKIKALDNLFPLASKEVKQEQLILMKPDEQKVFQATRAAEQKMLLKTQELYGLNPKIDMGTLAAIVRSKEPMAQRDTDGSIFTMVGGKKIILQQ